MSGKWRENPPLSVIATCIKGELFAHSAAPILPINMMTPRIHWIARLAGVLRALGPYAAIELVLPGGTLIALALWAIRRHSAAWAAVAGPANGSSQGLNTATRAATNSAVSRETMVSP